jgi:hypothetical protein
MPYDPTNPIGILIRLLLLLLLFLGISQRAATPPVPDGATQRSYTRIDSVGIQILEMYPYQVNLEVTGQQPDGCDFPVIVEQRREGNTIYVEIYRNVPLGVMCPMVLLPYDTMIHLDERLESGTYTINVNGTIVEPTL